MGRYYDDDTGGYESGGLHNGMDYTQDAGLDIDTHDDAKPHNPEDSQQNAMDRSGDCDDTE